MAKVVDRVWNTQQYKKDVVQGQSHAAEYAGLARSSNKPATRAYALMSLSTETAPNAYDRGWQVSDVEIQSSTACTFMLARQPITGIAAHGRRSSAVFTGASDDTLASGGDDEPYDNHYDGRTQQERVRDIKAALASGMAGRSAGLVLPAHRQRLQEALANAGLPLEDEGEVAQPPPTPSLLSSVTFKAAAAKAAAFLPEWLQPHTGGPSPPAQSPSNLPKPLHSLMSPRRLDTNKQTAGLVAGANSSSNLSPPIAPVGRGHTAGGEAGHAANVTSSCSPNHKSMDNALSLGRLSMAGRPANLVLRTNSCASCGPDLQSALRSRDHSTLERHASFCNLSGSDDDEADGHRHVGWLVSGRDASLSPSAGASTRMHKVPSSNVRFAPAQQRAMGGLGWGSAPSAPLPSSASQPVLPSGMLPRAPVMGLTTTAGRIA